MSTFIPKEDVVAYYLPKNACIGSIMAMGSVKAAVVTSAYRKGGELSSQP